MLNLKKLIEANFRSTLEAKRRAKKFTKSPKVEKNKQLNN